MSLVFNHTEDVQQMVTFFTRLMDAVWCCRPQAPRLQQRPVLLVLRDQPLCPLPRISHRPPELLAPLSTARLCESALGSSHEQDHTVPVLPRLACHTLCVTAT